jgi:enolase
LHHLRPELMEMYKDFCKNYPIITIEDPFDQDDWDNTTAFTLEGVSQVQLCSPI